MHLWLAAIAATVVQPLIMMALIAYDVFMSPNRVHGVGLLLSSVLVVAGAAVLVLGIPAFLLLHTFGRANRASLALAGFLLGALPVAALSWPGTLPGFSAGQNWHGHYIKTYIDGFPTQYAWFLYGEEILRFGMHGLAGALVFHIVWSRLNAHRAAQGPGLA